MTEIKDLLSSIDDLLNETSSPLQITEKLERYSNDFEVWYAQNQKEVQAGNIPEAEKLLERHEALVIKTQEWLKQAGSELGKLKIRGKGIRAYTDSLPKRISISRVRKG